MVATQYMGQKITYTKVPWYGGTFTTSYVFFDTVPLIISWVSLKLAG